MFRLLSLLLGAVLVLFGSVFSANLQIEPLFADKRFAPVDMLHAGCMQHIDVFVSHTIPFQEVHAILQFDPHTIDVLRVLPVNNYSNVVSDFSIGYDNIVYSQKNIGKYPGSKLQLFSLLFDARAGIDTASFSLLSGSYALLLGGNRIALSGSVALPFASVPECNPDIIPPSITLVQPTITHHGIPLDSSFVFSLQDVGKGIDSSTLVVDIQDVVHTIANGGIVMSGDLFVVQPRDRLPVATEISVVVEVSDLQSYGGANTSTKTFAFVTAPYVLLASNMSPMDIQRQYNALLSFQGSADECGLLYAFVGGLDPVKQTIVSRLAQKLSCDNSVLSGDYMLENTPLHSAASDVDTSRVSLFAITGWLLFLVALLLQLYYFVLYKKSKGFWSRFGF